MPIIIDQFDYDLSGPDMCEFLLDDSKSYLRMDSGRSEHFESLGYKNLSDFRLEVPEASFTSNFVTTETKIYEQFFYPEGTYIRTLEAPRIHRSHCKVVTAVFVYVLEGTDPNLIDEIEAAISRFSIQQLERDGVRYIQQIEDELENAGVNRLVYAVFIGLHIEKEARTIVYDGVKTLLDEVIKTDEFGLREVGSRWTCGHPPKTPPEHEVELPDGADPKNPVDAGRAIDEDMKKWRDKLDCPDLETTQEHISTIQTNIEFRTVMKIRNIRIGRCRFGQTKVPLVEKKVSESALYATVAVHRDVKNQFERDLKTCLLQSAIAIGVAAMIFGGTTIPVALKAYSLLVASCIKEKVKNLGTCFVVQLYVVHKKSPWGPL